MTMMEHSPRNRTNFGSPTTWGWVALAVAILLVFLFAAQIRDTFGWLLVKGDNASYAVLPRSVLEQRLRTAESEVSQTRYQAVLYQSLMDQYVTLRSETSTRPPKAFLTARVIARPPKTHYDTLSIEAGIADGVQVGDMVSVQNILLGTVTSLSQHTATVILISSPGTVRDGIIGKPQAIIEVKGQGGAAMGASVSSSVSVQVGDAVTDQTTGMLIAIVGAMTHESTDTANVLSLYLPVSLSSLVDVSITHAAL
jgi:cell shape-determining protein MreC